MTVPSSSFEQLKAEIVYRVLDNKHIKDECEFYETSFENDENSYTQAKADIIPDNDLQVYFSIPRNTRDIFITVSDENSDDVQKIIGNVEQINVRDLSRCTHRQVIRFENNELNQKSVFGIVLLPLSVSGILDETEETFNIGGKEYRFHLVTMLSKFEIELWEKNGFDALMEFFDSCGKDLLTLK